MLPVLVTTCAGIFPDPLLMGTDTFVLVAALHWKVEPGTVAPRVMALCAVPEHMLLGILMGFTIGLGLTIT